MSFLEKIDNLIYTDCETCRGTRLGIFAGAIIVPILMTIAILILTQ